MSDDAVPAGEIFTNTILQPAAAQAVREMFRALRGAQDPFVLQDAYYILPANFTTFDPAAAGLANMPEPEFVEWRQAPATVAITNVVMGNDSGGNPIATVTAAGHGATNGQSVAVFNVVGFDQFNSPNGFWAVTVIDANTLTLNGCTATGTYVSGGVLAPNHGLGQFLPMVARDYIEHVADTTATPEQTDQIYAWEGGVFKFLASSSPRQLRIVYRESGLLNTSTSAVIPIDDSLDFLATRAASIAGATKGAEERGAVLKMEALGPTGQADGSGGILGALLRIDIRNMQREVYRRPGFRARRNRPDSILF